MNIKNRVHRRVVHLHRPIRGNRDDLGPPGRLPLLWRMYSGFNILIDLRLFQIRVGCQALACDSTP